MKEEVEGKKKRGGICADPFDDLLPAAVKKFVEEILADAGSQKVAPETSSLDEEKNKARISQD